MIVAANPTIEPHSVSETLSLPTLISKQEPVGLPVGLPLGPPPSATQRLGARTARTDVQISWPQWISERL